MENNFPLTHEFPLSGGYESESGRLKTIELISPKSWTKVSPVQLPIGIQLHCVVQWDSQTFLVIGGLDGHKPRDETYLINIVTNQLKKGPNLKNARYEHACEELNLKGKFYIIVTGGKDGKNFRSTEVLDKDNLEQGWQLGQDLPMTKYRHQMVGSQEKKQVYVLGGKKGSGKEIFEFECPGSISTCHWKKAQTELKYGRTSFVAIPIPNSLSEKICG